MAVFKVKIDIHNLRGIVYRRGDAQSANGNGRNLDLGDIIFRDQTGFSMH